MDNSQNNIGFFPQMPICDKHSSIELNSDFSLPDYQPEIRRLISTQATVLPPSEYIGNGNAEINGEISYKLLYLGSDGEIYCASLSDKYGFTASLDFNAHTNTNAPVTLIPSCKCENVSVRVLGPRKLNVRTKLDCTLFAFSPSNYSPTLVGAHNKSSIENRLFETSCINVKQSERKSLLLNDFVSFDSQNDSIRIIDCSATPIFNECSANIDSIRIKGDALLKILYCNDVESSHPLCLSKKIPFSCELDCPGVNSLFECYATGVCFDEKLDFQENGVSIEFNLSACATAQKNESVRYVADAYSTEKVCENATTELSVVNALRCTCGNLTQNDVFSLDDIKLSRDCKIIDVVGNCNINELSCENGKLAFKGTSTYQLIYFLDGEYASLKVSSPVKYELDSRTRVDMEKPFKWCVDGGITAVRARHDGEKLFVDCELNLGILLQCENRIEILDEMIFGEYLKKRSGEVILCYPEKDATVWSIAKQYGESQRNIRSKNAIPENEEFAKKRYLII